MYPKWTYGLRASFLRTHVTSPHTADRMPMRPHRITPRVRRSSCLQCLGSPVCLKKHLLTRSAFVQGRRLQAPAVRTMRKRNRTHIHAKPCATKVSAATRGALARLRFLGPFNRSAPGGDGLQGLRRGQPKVGLPSRRTILAQSCRHPPNLHRHPP